MSLQLTDEQNSIVTTVRDFAARECGTREKRLALTNGGKTHHHTGTSRKLADLGFLGLSIPEKYGGAGGGLFDACLFVEEIAYNQIPVGSFAVTLIVSHIYLNFASEELKKEILGAVVGGTATAVAMSEPGSGSDVASLRCKAEKVDGGYRLNGQKTWISNAHHSDHILLVARTSDTGDKHQGISMIAVPTSTPRHRDPADRHDGRRGQRRVLHRLRGGRGAPGRGGGAGLVAADRRAQYRTGHRRGPRPRPGSPSLRRHPQLRQDPRTVRPPRWAPFRRCHMGLPSWPPSSNAPDCWCTTSLSVSTRTRAG